MNKRLMEHETIQNETLNSDLFEEINQQQYRLKKTPIVHKYQFKQDSRK